MLTKLTPTKITNVCPGSYYGGICSNEVEINLSSLKLGKTAGRYKLKDNIVLPICTTCAGTETLFRYWGTLTTDNPTYKIKAAINFLGKKLKEAGQLDTGCSADIMAETSDPPVILDDYPAGDGTL